MSERTITLEKGEILYIQHGNVQLKVTADSYGSIELEPYLTVSVPNMSYITNFYLHNADTDPTVVGEIGFDTPDGIYQELAGPFEFKVTSY